MLKKQARESVAVEIHERFIYLATEMRSLDDSFNDLQDIVNIFTSYDIKTEL